MFMFFFLQDDIQPDHSLVFYPGSGIDLSPILMPKLNGKGMDKNIRFIYCDKAPHVSSFFYELMGTQGNDINLEQYKTILSRYHRFIDSLDIVSISTTLTKKQQIQGQEYLSASLTIRYKDGESATPELFFFPVNADLYIDSIHKSLFDRGIHTLIHINQTDQENPSTIHFFSPSHFKNLLESHDLFKQVTYLVTDNSALFSSANWQLTRFDFPGWGASGNSMINDRTAKLLTRSSEQVSFVPQTDPNEKLTEIKERLSKLKFR